MKPRHVLAVTLLCIATASCGTVRTMPTLGSYGNPQIYSGARLDLDAIREDQEGLKRFKAKPPSIPPSIFLSALSWTR